VEVDTMLSKSVSKSGAKTKVTFKVTPDEGSSEVAVLGEFNDWNPESHKLARRKDGSFSGSASLESGKSYRFRYLVDGAVWVNDEAADDYLPNRFGGQDGVVSV
jgi:1,4-alpha-glucan branching enzyme